MDCLYNPFVLLPPFVDSIVLNCICILQKVNYQHVLDLLHSHPFNIFKICFWICYAFKNCIIGNVNEIKVSLYTALHVEVKLLIYWVPKFFKFSTQYFNVSHT